MSLILPAGRENAWRWNGATDELHLYVAPAWLGEVAPAAGVAAPQPVERFAFEDPAAALAGAGAARGAARGRRRRRACSAQALAETIALQLLREHCAVAPTPPVAARLAPSRLRRVRELVEERAGPRPVAGGPGAAAGPQPRALRPLVPRRHRPDAVRLPARAAGRARARRCWPARPAVGRDRRADRLPVAEPPGPGLQERDRPDAGRVPPSGPRLSRSTHRARARHARASARPHPAHEHPDDGHSTVKMWGDEPYYGLGYEFDPTGS